MKMVNAILYAVVTISFLIAVLALADLYLHWLPTMAFGQNQEEILTFVGSISALVYMSSRERLQKNLFEKRWQQPESTAQPDLAREYSYNVIMTIGALAAAVGSICLATSAMTENYTFRGLYLLAIMIGYVLINESVYERKIIFRRREEARSNWVPTT